MGRCAVVILAAGQGTRMRSPLPKVLHPVGDRTMLDRAIDAAQELKAAPILVVCAPDGAEVRARVEARLGADAVVTQPSPRGTADAVLAARATLSAFDGDVLVTTADAPLLSAAALQPLLDARSAGSDLVILGFEAADPGAYGRLLVSADGSLARIVEARDASAEELGVTLCNSGVLAAHASRLFSLLAEVRPNNARQEFYLTDVVGLARARGLSVVAVMARESEVLGVNSQAELAAAEQLFQTSRRAAALTQGVAMPAPETVVMAFDTVLEPGCRIEPYVVFGPGAHVRSGARVRSFSHVEGAVIGPEAQVGPFARLRPGARVGASAHVGNFVELKNLVLGDGAKANHLAYLGDGEVGAGANIGAGVIFCNYDGFAKHRTRVGAAAFVGSNAALVAPVTIGEGAYVASGSVVTRDVAPDALALARAHQVEKPGWARRFRDRLRAVR